MSEKCKTKKAKPKTKYRVLLSIAAIILNPIIIAIGMAAYDLCNGMCSMEDLKFLFGLILFIGIFGVIGSLGGGGGGSNGNDICNDDYSHSDDSHICNGYNLGIAEGHTERVPCSRCGR